MSFTKFFKHAFQGSQATAPTAGLSFSVLFSSALPFLIFVSLFVSIFTVSLSAKEPSLPGPLLQLTQPDIKPPVDIYELQQSLQQPLSLRPNPFHKTFAPSIALQKDSFQKRLSKNITFVSNRKSLDHNATVLSAAETWVSDFTPSHTPSQESATLDFPSLRETVLPEDHSPEDYSLLDHENCGGPRRTSDTILLVNVRRLGCKTDPTSFEQQTTCAAYQTQNSSEVRHWKNISLAQTLAELNTLNPELPLVVYVHGNRVSSADAKERGLKVYRSIVQRCKANQPIQFLIWSWPSAQTRGPLRDYRTKAARTFPVAWQFGYFMNQIMPTKKSFLVGYSFGARVICGALHLQAGGTLCRRALPNGDLPGTFRQPTNVILYAPALDDNWLGTEQLMGLATSRMKKLALIVNPKDPAMRFYFLLDRKRHPTALGLKGPTQLARPAGFQYRLVDASKNVGSTHLLTQYLAAQNIIRNAWDFLTDSF